MTRPTLTRLLEWNPTALAGGADALDVAAAEHLDAVTAAHERTRRATGSWTGAAADRALAAAEAELRSATAWSGGLAELARELRSGAESIGSARTVALAVFRDTTDGLGLVVTDAGRVAPPPVPWIGGPLPAALLRAALAEQARVCEARLTAALDAVDAADRATAAAVGLAAGALTASPHDLTPPEPGATPADNAHYWAALSEDQRHRVLAEHPGWIGNLDGIPAAVRDAANRAQLAADVRSLELLIDRAAQDPWVFDWGRPEVRPDLLALRARLAGVDAVARAIGDPDGRLLVYRGGERVRAAVAVGDVDTADHVAVFTPGVNSTALDLPRYVDDARGLRREVGDQLADAGRGDESVAVVAWLDYVPPQLDPARPIDSLRNALVDLGGAVAASDGAAALAAFYRGVAARPDGVHLTALGHSYGSTTAGLALQRGDTGVDDAVFFGSPGLGTDHVDDLGLGPGHVYVAEASGDAVADLAAYGRDPNRLRGVTNLSTATAGGLEGSTGHSEYLAAGTLSRHNIAAVVGGVPERIVAGTDAGLGDRIPGAPLGDLRQRLSGGRW
ncbi:alpha/beta hydrolase [Rhodococcus sp. NPDC003318]|uniref:alpha/beta hydrolase n=1 Tax=Rhodococcus sp. NPDC003318 TaxID=3364503 RepID=UPI0036CA236B